MFPSFIKTKFKLRNKFEKELRRQIREHQFLKIPEQIIQEGHNLVTRSVDGFEDSDELKLIESGFKVSDEELIEKGPKAVFNKIPSIVEDMVAQRSRVIFEKMDEVTERTGNVIDGEGKELSPELIFNTLEKIEINFDELGNPIMPTLVVNPEMYKKIQNNPDRWKETPEMKAKLAELLKKKYGEYIDRESRRKLVD